MVATVAEIEIPANEFALSHSLSMLTGLKCEVERVVAHDGDGIVPFVWISGVKNRDTVESTLADDPSTTEVELLSDLDDEWLYQMEWVSQIKMLVQVLVEEKGTIMAAAGNEQNWNLRAIFPNRDSLSRTYEYCEENGLTFDLLNIYHLEDGRKGRFGLTEEQQTTLTVAHERGYYQVPRGATAEDLAEELEISHQAVSERLRRGHGSLVENTLILGQGADNPDKK